LFYRLRAGFCFRSGDFHIGLLIVKEWENLSYKRTAKEQMLK